MVQAVLGEAKQGKCRARAVDLTVKKGEIAGK